MAREVAESADAGEGEAGGERGGRRDERDFCWDVSRRAQALALSSLGPPCVALIWKAQRPLRVLPRTVRGLVKLSSAAHCAYAHVTDYERAAHRGGSKRGAHVSKL